MTDYNSITSTAQGTTFDTTRSVGHAGVSISPVEANVGRRSLSMRDADQSITSILRSVQDPFADETIANNTDMTPHLLESGVEIFVNQKRVTDNGDILTECHYGHRGGTGGFQDILQTRLQDGVSSPEIKRVRYIMDKFGISVEKMLPDGGARVNLPRDFTATATSGTIQPIEYDVEPITVNYDNPAEEPPLPVSRIQRYDYSAGGNSVQSINVYRNGSHIYEAPALYSGKVLTTTGFVGGSIPRSINPPGQHFRESTKIVSSVIQC